MVEIVLKAFTQVLGAITAGFIFLFLILLILVTTYLCISCGVQLYNEFLKEEIERMVKRKNEIQRNATEVSRLRNLHRQK